MNDQQQLADNYLANRAAEIHDFFQSASDPNSDESELVTTAYRLGITDKDFQAHRSRQQEASLRF